MHVMSIKIECNKKGYFSYNEVSNLSVTFFLTHLVWLSSLIWQFLFLFHNCIMLVFKISYVCFDNFSDRIQSWNYKSQWSSLQQAFIIKINTLPVRRTSVHEICTLILSLPHKRLMTTVIFWDTFMCCPRPGV